MRRNNSSIGKRVLLIALFVAILGGISFGYAQLKETLTINGSAKINKVSWNVNLQNLRLASNSNQVVNSNNTVKIHTSNTTKEEVVYSVSNENLVATVTKAAGTPGGLELTFNVTLTEPGQSFGFDFDIENDGTLDAKLKTIKEDDNTITSGGITSVYTKTVEGGTEPYFKYSVTGAPVVGSELAANGGKKTVSVLVEYPELSDAQNLPASDYTFTKTIKFNYEQK